MTESTTAERCSLFTMFHCVREKTVIRHVDGAQLGREYRDGLWRSAIPRSNVLGMKRCMRAAHKDEPAEIRRDVRSSALGLG